MAKSANLLVDGLDSPARIGLTTGLHWQTVALMLAGVATGASVLLTPDPDQLAGCGAAFVLPEHAGAALDAGVDEVYVLSGHPLGAPVASPPAMTVDYAREVPGYADHFGGPRPPAADIRCAGRAVQRPSGLAPRDRVLATAHPATPQGAGLLLAALSVGASLVLLDDDTADLSALTAAERVTWP